MKRAYIRVYEIEYLKKVEQLVSAGLGNSFSEIGKKAFFEGVDLLYDRTFNKVSQANTQAKLEEISEKITLYAQNIKNDVRETMLIGYSLRQIISTIYNILLVSFKNGTIDEKSLELGLYDDIPERILELFESMSRE